MLIVLLEELHSQNLSATFLVPCRGKLESSGKPQNMVYEMWIKEQGIVYCLNEGMKKSVELLKDKTI